ncbi:DNA cytosine methyltransferase [Acanthopleuribacter pedis]|uniref:DNA (cytosine-5-)-methyltransferase n=1 Tax=Acanthopleuribacter pedis TaxID=442870 RepID=A0A8J7U0V7_9BACT|nr:DNA cytosine methyltransferase [Acanthopleuribacter pedis]MBO1317493.1 DNA cytosine methyltransferase [Acanthopleuribacter pedis]
MRSIELFTGAGGLALGTHLAGFHHQALVEREGNACATLERNIRDASLAGTAAWRGKVHKGDVRRVDFSQWGPVDLVAGGPPCQPFSIGGKHKGMHDDRDMIPEFIRALRALRPRAFILENVKGLLRQSFAAYFEYCLLRLRYPDAVRVENEPWEQHLARLEETAHRADPTGLAYRVDFKLLNAADYGVPQTRERVFLVGFRADTAIAWQFPTPTHSKEALLADQWVTGDYWKRHHIAAPPMPPTRYRKKISGLAERPEAVRGLMPWVTVRDALTGLPDPREEHGGFANHRHQPGARTYVGHTGSPIDWPSKTLKAGVHGVPGGENMIAFHDGSVRYFSVREAARMQTFPDAWVFEGAWSETMRQLGNAVPVQLAQTVAASVRQHLQPESSKKETQHERTIFI